MVSLSSPFQLVQIMCLNVMSLIPTASKALSGVKVSVVSSTLVTLSHLKTLDTSVAMKHDKLDQGEHLELNHSWPRLPICS